jgi:hypothetical protein
MPVIQGFAVLMCNPESQHYIDLVIKTDSKNLRAEDFNVCLKANSEELFLFDSIDKS